MTYTSRFLFALLLTLASSYSQDTPPTLTNYTWTNQNSMVAVQNADGNLSIASPAAVGLGFNVGMLLAPLPAAPYTITMGFTGVINGKAAFLAACLYEAGSGKIVTFAAPSSSDTNVISIAAFKMNSTTSYAGAYSPTGTTSYMSNHPLMIGGLLPRYIKIRDDGTYRSLWVGQTKAASFFPLSVVSRTDFITPTHYGYCMRGTGDGNASLMTVYHESVTTP